MDINYEKKISTKSSEEMKYEKNKDFLILRDFKQENLMKTYNPKNENVFKKKIFIKKMKMIIIIILLIILMIIMIMKIIIKMKIKKKIKN